MALHLVKSYCLPQLMYGCEIWPLNSVNVCEIDIIWNNGFRHIFNCCWRESIKPLQFYCRTLPGQKTVEWLHERTEHLNIFLFSAITQWSSISDVLFTGGRGVSDFSVLKYY